MLRRISVLLSLSIFLVFMVVQPASAATTYKVKAGDSLYKIACNYNTTVQKLQTLNKLGKQTRIYPGQKLTIANSLREIKQAVTRGSTASRGETVSRGTTVSQGRTLNRGIIGYTAQELDLLARLITAEAGGESYQAQLAVGAVVVNRVQSPIFPNSLTEVIYQVVDGHYQFTPVLNGWINKPATATSLKAAREALTGVDSTKGALYFFVTGTPNRFLQAKPVSTIINNITFSL